MIKVIPAKYSYLKRRIDPELRINLESGDTIIARTKNGDTRIFQIWYQPIYVGEGAYLPKKGVLILVKHQGDFPDFEMLESKSSLEKLIEEDSFIKNVLEKAKTKPILPLPSEFESRLPSYYVRKGKYAFLFHPCGIVEVTKFLERSRYYLIIVGPPSYKVIKDFFANRFMCNSIFFDSNRSVPNFVMVALSNLEELLSFYEYYFNLEKILRLLEKRSLLNIYKYQSLPQIDAGWIPPKLLMEEINKLDFLSRGYEVWRGVFYLLQESK